MSLRGEIEQSLHRRWYGDREPGFMLKGLELFYRAGFRGHQAWQRFRRARDLERRAIWVVGNLVAGGTGKTPFVIRLAELAKQAGRKPGIVSRGYGRTSHEPLRVTPDADPQDSGDEPLLIARRTAVPVQVDRDREAAARALFADGVDLVISDDGLQRARLPRALDICLVDRDRGNGNGHLLPAGPLREPLSRVEEVDLVVDCVAPRVTPPLDAGYWMRLVPGGVFGLRDNRPAPPEQLGGPLHAVTGIARPERFFETLRGLDLEFREWPFADHHRFSMADFSAIPGGDTIIMTEKDAIKCARLPLRNAFVLPVAAEFSPELEGRLKQELQSLSPAIRSGDDQA